MSNKIQGYGPQPGLVTGGKPATGVERASSDAQKVEKVQPTRDSVTLTDGAKQLQKLAEAVAAAPVVDDARVAAVKNAVDQGTYKIDAQRVADKLLQANRELPGR